MKCVRLSRILGIAVLATALFIGWHSLSPTSVAAASIIGGAWRAGGGCCNNTSDDLCANGIDIWGNHPCGGTRTNICTGFDPDYNCRWSGCGNTCFWLGFGIDICSTTHDSECENDPHTVCW